MDVMEVMDGESLVYIVCPDQRYECLGRVGVPTVTK